MGAFEEGLAAIVTSAVDPRQLVLDLVSYLDEHAVGAAVDAPETHALAHALVAAAETLVRRDPDVEATIEAGRAYCIEPTENRWVTFEAAATCSYPVGPGDGCLAVAEIGRDRCGRGSGCASGSGSIAIIAYEVGFDVVARAVREELRAWLDLHG